MNVERPLLSRIEREKTRSQPGRLKILFGSSAGVGKTRAMLAVILLIPGCASQPGWSRYEMYFGLSTDAGQTKIPDQQWQTFRDQEIVNRFPDGFTLYPGNGYWRSESGTYREPSEILMVVAPDTEETQKKLNAIAQAYIRRFHQEALLQIKSQAVISFHPPAERTLEGNASSSRSRDSSTYHWYPFCKP